MTQNLQKLGQSGIMPPTALCAPQVEIIMPNKQSELEQVISETVRQTLLELGLDAKNPIELQKDFAHLRGWREGVDEVKRKGFVAAISVIIAGSLGLMWAGLFKSASH